MKLGVSTFLHSRNNRVWLFAILSLAHPLFSESKVAIPASQPAEEIQSIRIAIITRPAVLPGFSRGFDLTPSWLEPSLTSVGLAPVHSFLVVDIQGTHGSRSTQSHGITLGPDPSAANPKITELLLATPLPSMDPKVSRPWMRTYSGPFRTTFKDAVSGMRSALDAEFGTRTNITRPGNGVPTCQGFANRAWYAVDNYARSITQFNTPQRPGPSCYFLVQTQGGSGIRGGAANTDVFRYSDADTKCKQGGGYVPQSKQLLADLPGLSLTRGHCYWASNLVGNQRAIISTHYGVTRAQSESNDSQPICRALCRYTACNTPQVLSREELWYRHLKGDLGTLSEVPPHKSKR